MQNRYGYFQRANGVYFFAVLNHKRAGNSTNHYLRRVQNFAFAMRWLFEPVIPNPEWPNIKKKQTMAISAEDHVKIIASEHESSRPQGHHHLCPCPRHQFG
jgi:hypothetical protein